MLRSFCYFGKFAKVFGCSVRSRNGANDFYPQPWKTRLFVNSQVLALLKLKTWLKALPLQSKKLNPKKVQTLWLKLLPMQAQKLNLSNSVYTNLKTNKGLWQNAKVLLLFGGGVVEDLQMLFFFGGGFFVLYLSFRQFFWGWVFVNVLSIFWVFCLGFV